MADQSPAMIWVTDSKGICTYLNQEWLNFMGQSAEQALDLGWENNIHPDDRDQCRTAFRQAWADPQPLQLEYRRCDRNQTYRWLLDTSKPRYLSTGEFVGMIGSCIDITPQKQTEVTLTQSKRHLEEDLADKDTSLQVAEDSLQESESRFFSLADSAPVLIWLSDAQGNCTYVNRTWQNQTGQSLDAQSGQGWLHSIHPEDRDLVEAIFQQSITQRQPFEQEFRQLRQDGAYRWILATGIPRQIADKFAGFICSCMDITEIKVSQKRLEQAIQELQRSNQELEQFAYIASHDLREPLRKIKSFAELLLEDLMGQLDEDQSRYFGYITSGADRMQYLIEDILQYSRVGRSSKAIEAVNLNRVIETVQSDLSLAIAESQVVFNFAHLPTIHAHKVEITQVFANLVNNAIKFRSEVPLQIDITAEQQETDWQISVTDNGIGISEDLVERVFVMFQRLHHRDQYPGTGIGLALCRKVVESHGGSIICESQIGQGSTFIIKLPIQPVVPIFESPLETQCAE